MPASQMASKKAKEAVYILGLAVENGLEMIPWTDEEDESAEVVERPKLELKTLESLLVVVIGVEVVREETARQPPRPPMAIRATLYPRVRVLVPAWLRKSMGAPANWVVRWSKAMIGSGVIDIAGIRTGEWKGGARLCTREKRWLWSQDSSWGA